MPHRSDIVLTTFNARYLHTALGLRSLLANLVELRPYATLLEFERKDVAEEVAEKIVQHAPKIVALSIYVWNVDISTHLIRLLKCIQPDIIIVLGGPEVSFETNEQAIVREADYVICGEGEIPFYQLCRDLLAGQRPEQKIISQNPLPPLSQLALPYDEYLPQDIANRIIYVERSRGCPYLCAFCLSALDQKVRYFPLDRFLQHMQQLLQRGVRHFKCVDRTFNLNVADSIAILQFFLQQRNTFPDLFLHVEMVPDRLPLPLKEIIQQFPAGALQFEIGIQSFNPDIQARIHRTMDPVTSRENLLWLLQHTGVHLHTDLIVGLPGETLDGFAASFDHLAGLEPHEIQIGILKRLRGTTIIEHSQQFGMVYSPDPPYELLCNTLLDFATLRRLKRFARFWDLLGNSGRFGHFRQLLLQQKQPFYAFLALSDWLYAAIGRTHEIALRTQFDWLFKGLTEGLCWDQESVLTALELDFYQGSLREPPDCLRGIKVSKQVKKESQGLPIRQARHRQNVTVHSPLRGE